MGRRSPLSAFGPRRAQPMSNQDLHPYRHGARRMRDALSEPLSNRIKNALADEGHQCESVRPRHLGRRLLRHCHPPPFALCVYHGDPGASREPGWGWGMLWAHRTVAHGLRGLGLGAGRDKNLIAAVKRGFCAGLNWVWCRTLLQTCSRQALRAKEALDS